MSLVQYDSSSDEENDVETVRSVVNTPQVAEDKASISSFLPPPKNRIAHNIAKPKGRILGAGSRNPMSRQIPQSLENVELVRSNASVTSFVPHSVRSKSQTQPTTTMAKQQPSRLFQEVKTKRKQFTGSEMKVDVNPIVPMEEEHVDDHDHLKTEGISNKRPLEPDLPAMKEFNVDTFYETNIELKEKGLLEENKRLHAVTNHKNQLSSLINNAKQDKELLEEQFERNKKARRERSNKYGW